MIDASPGLQKAFENYVKGNPTCDAEWLRWLVTAALAEGENPPRKPMTDCPLYNFRPYK